MRERNQHAASLTPSSIQTILTSSQVNPATRAASINHLDTGNPPFVKPQINWHLVHHVDPPHRIFREDHPRSGWGTRLLKQRKVQHLSGGAYV